MISKRRSVTIKPVIHEQKDISKMTINVNNNQIQIPNDVSVLYEEKVHDINQSEIDYLVETCKFTGTESVECIQNEITKAMIESIQMVCDLPEALKRAQAEGLFNE